jgi:nucleotide-binding universal stress UspA family protein
MPKRNDSFKKILVAVDGSTTCILAEELTAVLAKKFQSKVTVVHVVPKQPFDLGVSTPSNIPKSVLAEVSEWFVSKGEEIIGNSQALFREEGVKVDAKLLEGDPVESIIHLAAVEKHDLIVLGNRGETEVEVYSLGSNAEKIVRHAECSTLIVKEKTRISKILAAFDGSKNSIQGLQLATDLADKFDAKITVMYIMEGGLFGLKPKVAQKVGERILSKALKEVKKIKVTKRLESGSPAEKIIEVAKSEGYDLIVVGCRGLSRTKRFFLGSVSDDVSHHAPCSVFIVR